MDTYKSDDNINMYSIQVKIEPEDFTEEAEHQDSSTSSTFVENPYVRQSRYSEATHYVKHSDDTEEEETLKISKKAPFVFTGLNNRKQIPSNSEQLHSDPISSKSGNNRSKVFSSSDNVTVSDTRKDIAQQGPFGRSEEYHDMVRGTQGQCGNGDFNTMNKTAVKPVTGSQKRKQKSRDRVYRNETPMNTKPTEGPSVPSVVPVNYGQKQSKSKVLRLDKIIEEVKQNLIGSEMQQDIPEKILNPPPATRKVQNETVFPNMPDIRENYETMDDQEASMSSTEEFGQSGDIHRQSGESRYLCTICGKGFFYKSHLRKHTGIHLGIKPYTCSVCGKGFNQNSNMKTHMRTHADKKPFRCTTCDKGFNHNSSLQIHIRSHTGEKPFVCRFCNKGFNRNNTLKIHEGTHSEIKPYVCTTCGKQFGRRYILQRHVLIHTGDRAFSCSTCGKGFFQNSDLQKHLRTYENEEPLVCATCGKKFCQNCDYLKHMKTHKEDDQIFCHICEEKFETSSNMQEHLKTHERTTMRFVCTVCSEEFTEIEDFQEHKKIHSDKVSRTQDGDHSNDRSMTGRSSDDGDQSDAGNFNNSFNYFGNSMMDSQISAQDDYKEMINRAIENCIMPIPKPGVINEIAETELKLDKIIQEVRQNLEQNKKYQKDGGKKSFDAYDMPDDEPSASSITIESSRSSTEPNYS